MNDSEAFLPFGQAAKSSFWAPQKRRARVRARFVPAGRALHLVDVENLMGGPLQGHAALSASLASFARAAQVQPGDHVTVGVNPGLAFGVWDVWPHARLAVGGGPNGADNALLATVEAVDWVAPRYDRIVVGSGDGIFSVVVATYRAMGIPVGLVSRATSLSMTMAALASWVALIPSGKESLS